MEIKLVKYYLYNKYFFFWGGDEDNMDRQEEYELRQKISDAIAKDVSNVMADAQRECNSKF